MSKATENTQTTTTSTVFTQRKKMKRLSNPVIPKGKIDYTPKSERKEQEITLSFKPCIICNKQIEEGYYARWGNGGVCSKTCNEAQSLKPLYPEHGSTS